LPTILYLNECGKDLSIHTTVSKLNHDDIKKGFVPFLKKYGQLLNNRNHFSFTIARQVGRGKELLGKGLLCGFVEFEKLIFDVYSEILEEKISTTRYKKPQFRDNCGVGKQIIVSPNGNCYLCGIPTSEVLGNIMEDGLKTILARMQEKREQLSQTYFEACKGCELKGFCMGGCRVFNKTVQGSYIVPCCTEDFKESMYRMLVREYVVGYVNI
jgi:radical SAM protein with 4Fe4S-binding SPASM domain